MNLPESDEPPVRPSGAEPPPEGAKKILGRPSDFLVSPPEIVGRHFFVAGRVQGVGFRWSLCAQADRLGVSGWVRNRLDGRVEALACGEHAAVMALLAWARQGPPGARVNGLQVEEVPVGSDLAGAFEQRPTI